MEEYKIGDTRTIIQGKSKQNEIYIECPLCHECRWTEMRNGVARYPRCKHHKPTPQTEEAKKNNSIGLKKSYLDPIKRASHALGQKKRYERQEERDLQKQRITIFLENHPEYRESQGTDSLERFSKPEELEKLSVAQTIRWSDPLQKEHSSIVHKALWDIPEFADKMLDCIAKGNTHKQTGHEKVMESILIEYFPNQWRYTGNRTVKIGRKYPDFMHNGSNLLIECFGDYWHKGQNPQDKVDLFAQFGYNTLVLWEHEILKLPRELVAQRVNEFMDKSKEGSF